MIMIDRFLAWIGVRRLRAGESSELQLQLAEEQRLADALRVKVAQRSFELEAMAVQFRRVEEALRFYADARAWTEVAAPQGATRATMDSGKRARAALGRK